MRSVFLTAALVTFSLHLACSKPVSGTPAVAASPLTRANFDRIQIGMTLPEVEALLGPAGVTMGEEVKQPDGSTRKLVRSVSWGVVHGHAPEGEVPRDSEDRWIAIELDDGKVTAKRQKGLE
jgi:hypothetical protein